MSSAAKLYSQAFMVKVDQAEAEPAMAAEIATAIFMVVIKKQ